uniref:GLTSCR protein conserved domain-containing protein n=1 Tax=Romanomermis culicivorax TaxID=13658 RepID=A0A915HQD9_ROMCU
MDSAENAVPAPKRPARFRLLHGKKSKFGESRNNRLYEQRPQFRSLAPPIPPFYNNQNSPNNGVQKTIQLSSEDQKRLAELTNRLTLILQGRTAKDCTLREKENIEKLEQQRRVILESAMVRQQAPQCVVFNGQPVQFHDQRFVAGPTLHNGAFKQQQQQPCMSLSFGNLPPSSKPPILSGHIVQPSTSCSKSNYVDSWRCANYNLQQNRSRISCQNISKRLENDKFEVSDKNPARLKKPFRNFDDIRDRLLPYHLYDEPDVDEKFLDLFDKLNDARAKILSERSKKWLDKFRFKVLEESSKSHADGETILLQKLWLDSEREHFNQFKVKLKDNLKEEGNSVPTSDADDISLKSTVDQNHVVKKDCDQNFNQEEKSLRDLDHYRKIEECIEIVYNRVVSNNDLPPPVVISLPKIDLQVQQSDTAVVESPSELTKIDEICLNLAHTDDQNKPIVEIFNCQEKIVENCSSSPSTDDILTQVEPKIALISSPQNAEISADDEPRIVAEELSPPTTTGGNSSPLICAKIDVEKTAKKKTTKRRRFFKYTVLSIISKTSPYYLYTYIQGDIQEKPDKFLNIPISNGKTPDSTEKRFNFHEDEPSKKVPPLKIRLNKRPAVPQPMTKHSIGLESSDSSSTSDLDVDVCYEGKIDDCEAKKRLFFVGNGAKIVRGSFANAKILSPGNDDEEEEEDEFL